MNSSPGEKKGNAAISNALPSIRGAAINISKSNLGFRMTVSGRELGHHTLGFVPQRVCDRPRLSLSGLEPGGRNMSLATQRGHQWLELRPRLARDRTFPARQRGGRWPDAPADRDERAEDIDRLLDAGARATGPLPPIQARASGAASSCAGSIKVPRL
jgi:hypothetical protein